MSEYLTLIIKADRFDASPIGWSKAAVAHAVKGIVAERVDLAGIEVFIAEELPVSA